MQYWDFGGVGSFVFESFARNGVENMILCDKDTVDITNLNRQLVAEIGNIGRKKTEIARKLVHRVNDKIRAYDICKEIKDYSDLEEIFENTFYPDYIIDAVDDINAKIMIIRYATEKGIKIITSTGAAQKTKPWMVKMDKIYNTKNCPLGKILRKRLKDIEKEERIENNKKISFKNVYSIYSEEIPQKSQGINKTLMEVTSTYGIFIAAYVINDICGKD